jgi:hypothetical protein
MSIVFRFDQNALFQSVDRLALCSELLQRTRLRGPQLLILRHQQLHLRSKGGILVA